MSIDPSFIGFKLPRFDVRVDDAELARFRAATGAAMDQASGDCLPPTYLKVIEGTGGSSRTIVEALGIDLRRMLHAGQEFEYLRPIKAGDTVTVEREVTAIEPKKGGALELVVIASTFRDTAGRELARSRQSLLVRNPVPR